MADIQACEYEEIGDGWKVVSNDGRRISEWMSKLGLMGENEATMEQLERLAFMMDWGPIMELPVRNHRGQIRPAIDEQGQLDWGAFGTVDLSDCGNHSTLLGTKRISCRTSCATMSSCCKR